MVVLKVFFLFVILITCTTQHLVKNVTLLNIINQKNHVSFMPHVLSQNEHPSWLLVNAYMKLFMLSLLENHDFLY